MLILIKSQTRRERPKIAQGGAQRNPGNAAWSNIPPWRGGTKPNRGLNPYSCDSLANKLQRTPSPQYVHLAASSAKALSNLGSASKKWSDGHRINRPPPPASSKHRRPSARVRSEEHT